MNAQQLQNIDHILIKKGSKNLYCCPFSGKILLTEKEQENEKNKYFHLFNSCIDDFCEVIASRKVPKREINNTYYYGFFEPENFESKGNFYQLDVVQAYYNVSLNNYFISEKTDKKVKKLLSENPQDRSLIKAPLNISIGFAGMPEKVYFFDSESKEYEYIETRENPLKSIRNKVVTDLAIIMHDLCKKFNVSFFWVDAIFLENKEQEKEIRDYMKKKYNLEFSEAKEYRSSVLGKKITLHNKEESKYFFLPSKTTEIFCKYKKPY